MIVRQDISFRNFRCWGGAETTKVRIIYEGYCEQFEDLVDELFPDGIDEEKLNDWLWFDYEQIYEMLGMAKAEEG